MIRRAFVPTSLCLGLLVAASPLVLADTDVAPTPTPVDRDAVSFWDEERHGPLPRHREGGTPEPDPNQSLVPYSIRMPRATPTTGAIVSPPEYAPTAGVLYRYSTTSFASVVTDLVAKLTSNPIHDEIAYVVVSGAAQESSARTQFLAAGANLSKVEFIQAPTDAIWIRDYGPHFIFQDGTLALVDSHYYPTRPLDNFIPTLTGDDYFKVPTYDMGLYYSGGNFQPSADGGGFITSLIDQDNPGFGTPLITELYQKYQGIDTLHIFPRLPSSVDSTGHIDMWMYLIDEDTVIISEFLPGSNATAITVTNNTAVYMANLGYQVFRTPAKNGPHSSTSNAHFTYTNAFRVNDRIFVPTYGQGDSSYLSLDAQALATWQAAAPGVEIVPVNSYPIIWASGAIHCIVMQVPRYTDATPSAVVLSPQGEELLVAGTTHEISWHATDDGKVGTFDLLYSTNGGASFDQTIAAGLTGETRTLAWSVPALENPEVQVKVVVSDTEANSSDATSAASFGVASASRSIYDFSSGAGTLHRAWGYQTTSWSVLDSSRRAAEVGSELPVLDGSAYSRLATSNATGGDSDTNRYRAPVPLTGRESSHIFEMTIAEPPATIHEIVARWEGYGDACVQVELYVWDYVAGRWCDGSGQCGENRYMDSFAGNRDSVLTGTIREEFSRYIDPLTSQMTFLVYAERFEQETFHDYFSVSVTHDNCLYVENLDQTDGDGDFVGDACDNCLATINTDQANDDADPYGNACDCAPFDGGAFALPTPVNGLQVSYPGSLAWGSQSTTAGPGIGYDILRGALGELPVGGGPAESCLINGWPSEQFDDLSIPAADSGYWYLIRATNTCGSGGYGNTSEGTPRETTACP